MAGSSSEGAGEGLAAAVRGRLASVWRAAPLQQGTSEGLSDCASRLSQMVRGLGLAPHSSRHRLRSERGIGHDKYGLARRWANGLEAPARCSEIFAVSRRFFH